MTTISRMTADQKLNLDLWGLADINPDAAGEILLAHIPDEISSRCRFSFSETNPRYGTGPKKWTAIDPTASDLTDLERAVAQRIRIEDEPEMTPFMLRTEEGIVAAYLCDHDSTIIIAIPANATHAKPLIIENTDAKKDYDWHVVEI